MDDDGEDRHGPPKSNSKSSPTARRPSFKTHHPSFDTTTASWKRKLRDSCYQRVRDNRAKLLWKIRSPLDLSLNHKEVINSAFQGIVSDELKKIKDSSLTDLERFSNSTHEADGILWEYDGLHSAYQGECEEILLEMQKIFYEDLNAESINKDLKTWEDEEDEYLACAVYEQMQLNDVKVWKNEIWCPICKQGELQESRHLIYCTLCKLQLNRGNEGCASTAAYSKLTLPCLRAEATPPSSSTSARAVPPSLLLVSAREVPAPSFLSPSTKSCTSIAFANTINCPCLRARELPVLSLPSPTRRAAYCCCHQPLVIEI